MLVIASLSLLGIAFFLLSVIILILRHKSSMIFGIYPRKGLFYHLKYYLALMVLAKLRKKHYLQKESHLNNPEYLEQIDRAQELCSNPKSYDVVSFWGANAKGEKLIVNLERRRRGILKACIYVYLPQRGLLCSPNLPDMLHFSTDGQQENTEFKGSGFHIYPEQSMRLWHLHFEGQLKLINSNELLSCKLNLKFSSIANYFDYNRDLSGSVIADSIAREAWNDEFYQMLKHVDQILSKRMHYEQNGWLEGEALIGEQSFQLKLKAFRDHSFGTERCLSSINRYVYLSLFLEDGTTFVIGNLSQPSFFLSSLKVGYVCNARGQYQPITSCNFELYSYGEKGTPPKHQNFIVCTAEAKYFVQITAEEQALRYIGGDWESKCYNQFVSCTVNGIKGQGMSEFLYRNTTGRPSIVGINDPEWYRKARHFERSLSTGQHVDENEEFFF